MYNFTPKTDEEIAQMMTLPEGKYEYEVIEIKDGFAKDLITPMTTLQVLVYAPKLHQEAKLRTWIRWPVDTDTPQQLAFKLRTIKSFCDSAGYLDHYLNQTLSANLMERARGWCEVGLKHSSQYGWQNTIDGWIVKPDGIDKETGEIMVDDDVPF